MKVIDKKSFRLIQVIIAIALMFGVYIRYNIPYYSHKVFGVSYMTMNNSFYEVINVELEKVVESHGDALITLDPALDTEKQIEQIQRFIQQRVTGIFVNPVDSQAIVPVLREAKAAGISVFVIDTQIEEEDLVDCTIISDNYNAGVQCALDMMKRREEADVILLRHSEALSASDRIQGFLDTIADHPQYRIVGDAECEGQLEKAMPVMMDLLATCGHVDVVMALNDPSALGAMAALEKCGVKDAVVYGVDGTPDFKSLIGVDPIVAGTVAQSPISMGRLAGEMMYERLNAKMINKTIVVPVDLIHQDNIDEWSRTGWQ